MKKVEMLVCDNGIGIPKSLMTGRSDIKDEVSALRKAINEGVTRNHFTNQGNDLYGTFRCCEVSGGEFQITTGRVKLDHSKGRLTVSKGSIPFHGTFVRACISYEYANLLEKALIFKGKPYTPANDFVERLYQQHGESIEFVVKNELEAFGSRDAGKFAKNKIDNLMDKRRIPIVFDFSGVTLITSSFADEVFGRMFVEMGPINFSRLCDFRNVSQTIQRLIDRAISQRVAQSSSTGAAASLFQ